MSGSVTLRKVAHSFAPRSIAASSRWRSKPINRAFTVTTAKLMQNMTWAIRIVQKPKTTLRFRKSVSNDAPRTISGVDSGKKDQDVGGAPSAEAVADERERDQGSQHGRDEAREQRDLQREEERAADTRERRPSTSSCPT